MTAHKNKLKKSLLFLALFFLILLGISLCISCCSPRTEDEKFEAFATEVFKNELAGSTLNLHYSLANPEKWDIHTEEATLGRISTNRTELYEQLASYENTLKKFSYSELSTENQLTLDTLLLNFHTEQSIADYFLLEEYLSPSLGIQAQLPVLLAEYTFRREQDITDYLSLLQDIGPYFQSILEYEQVKSDAGLFMSDETVDRIQDQCFSFIADPESNYMLNVFADKINEFSTLSDTKKQELISLHEKLLLDEVIPAYKELITGLENLRGTGRSPSGLYYFQNGTDYYEYLLKSNAGIYTPIAKLEYRLSQQLYNDTQSMNLLLKENPEILKKYASMNANQEIKELSPEEMMSYLIDIFQQDFPAPVSTDYELTYVHESMEEFLSPAFYLTPPIDTGTPNTIYLNRSSMSSALETFTTLAHEGYPGHLYQTTYFTSMNTHPVRRLFSCNGYVEGWATYVESFAYEYAADALGLEPALTKLAHLNRSATLCLYSLLDIGIHYRGWTEVQMSSFLKNFGITNETTLHEIFLYIVENPANYVQYYCSYLNFLDLRTAQEKKLREEFQIQDFHRAVLEIGPVPFPVLEKYMGMEG